MNISVGKTRIDLVEPFRRAVERSVWEGGEVGIQVAAYSDSKLVVDIWAGVADPTTDREVKADTLFPTFSVIKAVTATVLHIQVARGLVDYDTPVARYSPEFAINGKDKVTVQHVLHHRSGVWQMPEAVTPERLADYDWMVDAIARLPPMFEPGTRNGYQGLTFGWMTSEVVRRTDPKGRSFRTFVQDEIIQPLGIDDLWMGVPVSEHPRVARLIDAPPRKLAPDAPPFRAIPLQVGTREDIFGRKDVRQSCIPGAGGFATARAIARFFAMLANGGALGGVRILPEALVQTFSQLRPASDQPDDVQVFRCASVPGSGWAGTRNTKILAVNGDNPRAIGHPGAGGSIAWAVPDKRLAVAICHNRMFLPPNTAQDPIRQAVTEAFGAD